MNQNKEKFDELFDLEQINKEVNKVKRHYTFKLTLVNLVVLASVLLLLAAGIYQVRHYQGEKVMAASVTQVTALREFERVPNTTMAYASYLSGNLRDWHITMVEYKHIGDNQLTNNVLVTDSQTSGTYVGLATKKTTTNRLVDGAEELIAEESIEVTNGRQNSFYFHPLVDFTKLPQDLTILASIKEDSLIEMGLSFDRGYTEDEVRQFLPVGLTPSFYWLDGYHKDEVRNFEYTELQGFEPMDATNQASPGVFQDVAAYLSALNNSKVTLYTNSSVYGDKSEKNNYGPNVGYSSYEILTEKIKKKEGVIIGLSVVGTKKQLAQIKPEKWLRASSLGAISESPVN